MHIKNENENEKKNPPLGEPMHLTLFSHPILIYDSIIVSTWKPV